MTRYERMPDEWTSDTSYYPTSKRSMRVPILFGIALFVGAVVVAGLVIRSMAPSKEVDWDYFVFAQFWPQTSCIDHKAKSDSGSCRLFNNVTSWTIHGLWPSDSKKAYPQNCDTSWKFDVKQLSSIRNELLKNWVEVYGDRPEDSLWQHEWDKHGTCAAELNPLDTELKYFKTGLDLNKKYNISAALAKKEIIPKDEAVYYKSDILKALKEGLGAEPQVSCAREREGKVYINQVMICLNLQLKIEDCSKFSMRVDRSCHNEDKIYYKPIIATQE